MKNLTVYRRHSRLLPDSLIKVLAHNPKQSGLCCTVDSNRSNVYILQKNLLYVIPQNPFEETICKELSVYGEIPVGLEFCSVTQQLYCAYQSGEIITVNVESDFECEVAALISEGLHVMQLSPDHEVLTLVTTNDVAITMLSDFCTVSEVNLQASDFGQKQFITVGWGKKETQFHGSEGKTAAKTKPVPIDRNESDDGLPRIAWRGDGQMFAISFLHSEKKARLFKVFSRAGVLQYTSEFNNGLEESLAWRPTGDLIAISQRLNNKYVIALFEKNGLRHAEFQLPFEAKEFRVKKLFWSTDSEVLAVWSEQYQHDMAMLQLWTRSNYHWYLKQTIKFLRGRPLLYAVWNIAGHTAKELVLLTSVERIMCSFRWTVNCSRGKSTNDKTVIGVIDGNNLLLTGLRIGIVPPPMAHQVLNMEKQINAVIFAPDVKREGSWVDSNTFCCCLVDNTITFFKCNSKSSSLEYEYISSYKIEWDKDVLPLGNELCHFQHFLWYKEDILLCSASIDDQSFLCIVTLENVDIKNEGRVIIRSIYKKAGTIEDIIPSPDMDGAYFLLDGYLLKHSEGQDCIDTKGIELHKGHSMRGVEVVRIGTNDIVISLSQRNCLSINGREIANNITSFYVHSEFLLLTSAQHTLICVPLDEGGLEQLFQRDLTVKPWDNVLDGKRTEDSNVRRIERESFLIAAVPQDSKTILQMPRGNLECIHPRPLSLYIIGVHLDKCNYASAFDLMRKQRINLNFIYDHNPRLFLENAEKFVNDIGNPSWISLFLSELREEGAIDTTCINHCNVSKISESNPAIAKVEYICDLLRDIMESKNNAENFIYPILISLVKSRKRKGLEDALRKVKETQRTEDALKYLLYLVDTDVLFDTALGMYDFDLAMFVASKSQKDPREYLPFLNNLRNMEERYMKYSVDMHLRRYESALEHISQLTDKFHLCRKLVSERNLYIKALKLFDKGSKEYKEIAKMYGEDLFDRKRYQEAGMMFQRSGEFESALRAYKLAGTWQEALIVSALIEQSLTDSQQLCKELVARLKEDKRYREAADILFTRLHDEEGAIVLLSTGKYWKDALRIAYDTKHIHLIEERIKPDVYEQADYMISRIEKNKEDFEKYRTRLVVVRKELTTRRVRFAEDHLSTTAEALDLFSDAGSVASSIPSQKSRISTASGRTYRSSKNRRKQERKLLSMKEGSTFEDLALIRALHEIVSSTYKQKDETNTLIEMLMYFEEDRRAEKLDNDMRKLLRTIEESKAEIWSKTAPTSLSDISDVTSQHHPESLLPQKLIEPYLTSPPEADSSVTRQLDFFKA